jgi:serine O-acetyltransferase
MLYLTLLSDFQRKAELYGIVGPNAVRKVLFKSGSLAMILYRIMWFLEKKRLSFISVIFYKMLSFFCHCLIGRRAEFGDGFVIMHTFGIVVNSTVRGGKNITIQHGVTIGENRGKSPVLGDDVFIGAGAKLFGDIRIGSRVKIGANSTVIKDVPDGALISGVPAIIVRIESETH